MDSRYYGEGLLSLVSASTARFRVLVDIPGRVYSSFFTPFEFGFFRGLGERLFILDVVGQLFIAYRDSHTYRMVYKHNWIALRIIKLIVVELYCTHTVACIFYYLATTLPASQEGYTWIGSLKLGDYSYSSFRDIDLWKCYTTSLYFATGYGDIHAVNLREMIFIMDIRNQIKGHLRLQYESTCMEAAVLQEIPASIHSKISQTLYFPYIESVPLFKGCSTEFINQIIMHEEFFLPGEVIMEPGSIVDQLYFVCHGVLEEVGIGEDGTEETLELLEPNSSFGEISILCNIPQLFTVRGKAPRMKQLESDITFHIGKQEAEFALKVNHGDLFQLKGLIRTGADPNKTDYDGRSPLHLAALKGHEDSTLVLIQEGVDINIKDNFGKAPLLEAIKNRNDRVSSLLIQQGACLNIDNAGCFICTSIARGDADLLKRLLANGIDPNSKDYDHRTPLHVAASEGLYIMAKLLLEAGASVFSKDRWGNTPLDEGRMCGNKNLIKLLEEAKAAQLTEFPYCAIHLITSLISHVS
ncbi:unnamed protein product [Malus baccata var. baccata]